MTLSESRLAVLWWFDESRCCCDGANPQRLIVVHMQQVNVSARACFATLHMTTACSSLKVNPT